MSASFLIERLNAFDSFASLVQAHSSPNDRGSVNIESHAKLSFQSISFNEGRFSASASTSTSTTFSSNSQFSYPYFHPNQSSSPAEVPKAPKPLHRLPFPLFQAQASTLPSSNLPHFKPAPARCNLPPIPTLPFSFHLPLGTTRHRKRHLISPFPHPPIVTIHRFVSDDLQVHCGDQSSLATPDF
jgi:hypothetical protein